MRNPLLKVPMLLLVGWIGFHPVLRPSSRGVPQPGSVKSEDVYIPKIGLTCDLGSPAHWERVIEFARTRHVSRLVLWGSSGNRNIYLYPKYPKLLPDADRAQVMEQRELLRRDAELTHQAGMGFWYVFLAVELPGPRAGYPAAESSPSDKEAQHAKHVRDSYPELFNAYGEPDMGNPKIYQLISDQLDELRELVPHLEGVELWVEEDATVKIAHLGHQKLSVEQIAERVVQTVHDNLRRAGIKLAVDLHTSGGDVVTREGLLKAAQRHPDIIVGADNTVGDFNATLPFNQWLIDAGKTNPIQVHFALNGETWGRNFVPSSALNQYATHIEIARELRAVYVDGRVSIGLDTMCPYANVLPSRRRFYPTLAKLSPDKPLPPDLDITSTDTLGAFNAEFFCRRVRDPQAKPEDAVRDFLTREFGSKAAALVPTFMKLEGTLRKMFFTDTNYFGFQSVLPSPAMAKLGYLHAHLTCPPGTPFPTPEMRKELAATTGYHFSFVGWPTPLGHRCAGPTAMIREKQEALDEAEEMLREVRKGTEGLKPVDRDFLASQFEDLVYFAKARRALLGAMVNYYLKQQNRNLEGLPDPTKFKADMAGMRKVAEEWRARYPGGRYLITEKLEEWLKVLGG